ncbi:hypothetical protein [Pedobacter sp. GR22-6]|uniref:hypothetical protein n=1 Tax=Pedobacter sp. GR22-6 TaxID=3127957 RepID=UPI00307F4F4A
MTRKEFKYAMPDIITHKTWGYGELICTEIDQQRVFAGYQHNDKRVSYGTIGVNWKEVYDDLMAHLTRANHIPAVA